MHVSALQAVWALMQSHTNHEFLGCSMAPCNHIAGIKHVHQAVTQAVRQQGAAFSSVALQQQGT